MARHEPRIAVLFVREDGTGPPLLLLHGLLATGDLFAQITPRLREHCRLLAPDLRGHGRERRLPGPYDAEAIAADLAPTLDALGVDSAHVLGHSHGGAAAQVFARAHPSRVRSLILVSTYTRQRLTWWERLGGLLAPPTVTRLGMARVARLERLLRSAGGGRRLTPEAAALGAAAMAANDGRQMAAGLSAARRFDSRGWLGTLQMPTLVVAGDADRVVSPRQARLLAEGMPGARLRVLPGAGHQVPLSHSVELATLVAEWLAEVENRLGGANILLGRGLPSRSGPSNGGRSIRQSRR
jgi:3-oxoadipate enol-lactonase